MHIIALVLVFHRPKVGRKIRAEHKRQMNAQHFDTRVVLHVFITDFASFNAHESFQVALVEYKKKMFARKD